MNEFFFRILNAIISHSAVLDRVVYFLAQPTALLATLALAVYAAYEIMRTREASRGGEVLRKWVLVFASAILAWFLADILQGFIAHPRPFLALSDTNLLFPYGDHDSFPSGHAAFLSGITGALYFFFDKKRLVWVFAAVTILVALSRVAAGVHWPLDILGGIALGVGVAWGVFRTRKYFK